MEKTNSFSATSKTTAAPFWGIVVAQVTGVFLLCFLCFAVSVPGIWHDHGFPALLDKVFGFQHTRNDAFTRIVSQEGGVNRFATAASTLTTTVVLLGLCNGDLVMRFAHSLVSGVGQHHSHVHANNRANDSSTSSFRLALQKLLALAGAALSSVCFHECIRHFFSFTFERNWKFGFDWAHDFFTPEGGVDFGNCTAAAMTWAFGLGALVRIFGRSFYGLYPEGSNQIIIRSLTGFVASLLFFRHIINPVVIQSLAFRLGLITMEDEADIETLDDTLDLNKFALLAAATHTFAFSAGICACYVFKDVLDIMPNAGSAKHLVESVTVLTQFLFVGGLGVALFYSISMWFTFASEYNVEFVNRYQSLAFDKPGGPFATTIAGVSYALWFFLGAVATEVQSFSATCARYGEKTGIRRADGKSINTNKTGDSSNKDDDETDHIPNSQNKEANLTAPLAMATMALFVILFVADPQLLGHRIGQLQRLGASLLAIAPAVWERVYENFTQDQIFFLTLPVLFLTEVPLMIFSCLDLLQLRCLDEYRIHYSLIDEKRPRSYPSKEELLKCLKIHIQNFYGVYCMTFLVGVGSACLFEFYPYSFSRKLPDHWPIEFLVVSFLSDVLFYWIHRVAHHKRLYASMHKMHHEWVYTIALAHHYMDWTEALLFMIPPVLPPMLFGTHVFVMWLYMFFVQINGILGHSAFCIPLFDLLRPSFCTGTYHDLHHLRFNCNYGAIFELTDQLFGTYRSEPVIYRDGLHPELADSNDKNRALAGVKDDDDPFEDDEIKNGGYYVYAKGETSEASRNKKTN